MRLYLVRHGVAINRNDPACPPDPERPLTPKGVTKTKAVARGLITLQIQPRVMASSPYLRAVQTAEIICEALGFPVTKLRRTDALKPESKPSALLGELSRLKAGEVMCVGHAPNLDEIVAFAVGSNALFTALKKAGVACLEMESLDPPKGQLVWLHTPKTLRLLGK